MADLTVTVNGLHLPNPFVIGSGPPGTNANVIAKAFDEGWGAVVAKTISLDASKVVNVAPRYARLRVGKSDAPTNTREIIGWQNIELISDRPFDVWLDEFRELKRRYPDRILIASIMEEYRKEAWVEIIERCQDLGDGLGVDAFELNFSCPHGLPERKMGSAMGQDPEILKEVCGWVNGVATKPVWAKMTPNITHIEDPARACLTAGCEGLSAINTILCVIGVDLATLRPEPTVEGYTTPGGYSCKAIRPIALRMVMECARMIRSECSPPGGAGFQPADSSVQPAPHSGQSSSSETSPERKRVGGPLPDDRGSFSQNAISLPSNSPISAPPMPGANEPSISGIGGIETGEDAAQFILLGASTVQVCTGVMIHGYGLIKELCRGLSAFMDRHGFKTIEEFRGHSLRYFTTHADLVARQAAARAAATGGKPTGKPDGVVTKDTQWSGEKFVEQSSKLVANG